MNFYCILIKHFMNHPCTPFLCSLLMKSHSPHNTLERQTFYIKKASVLKCFKIKKHLKMYFH